ncbi:MAG TPA: ABC-2 family transporter protein [Candidatus Limiplasma sp.]|nr:ABC-2 family transporter protein [Candidatus Limiplasma sp.]
MKRHLKIALRYFKVNLASAMEYRSSFLMQAFGMALSNATFVFFWWVAFSHVGGRIGGYDFADVMFIWALCSSAFGLSNVLFANISHLTRLIVTGELDTFLLQPCNVLMNVCCARTSLSAYGDLLYGIVLLALTQGGNGAAWASFALGVPVGAAVITAVGLTAHTLTFLLGDASLAGSMSVEFIINFCIYPEGIYQKFVRALMYSVIPAAFIVHIPLRLARSFSPGWLALWLAASVLYCGFACWFFYRGLKKYESGNLIITRL